MNRLQGYRKLLHTFIYKNFNTQSESRYHLVIVLKTTPYLILTTLCELVNIQLLLSLC